ncbi:MAG: very short patch repair endonuclease [Bacteroidaceae bacterium]
MPDRLTPEQRRRNMAAVRAKDTKPELEVRRYLWSHGFRYRLNHPRLPGKPDIVLRRYRTCIFVNGCFWHGHEGCKYFVVPKTRTGFWQNKVNRNRERDIEVQKKLAAMGWHSITIWECELKPAKRDKTLLSLVYTLSKIFLQDHQVRKYGLPEEDIPMMVAENPDDGTADDENPHQKYRGSE